MVYYTKPFNLENTLGLPKVTREYLLSIGVKEKSIGYYDEPENHKYDIPEISYPIKSILSLCFDCVVPVKKRELSISGYLLARRGKECYILYIDGDFSCYHRESYLTIIPPINSDLFVVQNKKCQWGVISLNKKDPIVEFGKYKYLWGYDTDLCLVETNDLNTVIFSNRGVINSEGQEVIKPYTYTDIFDFYGKGGNSIKVEDGNDMIFIEKEKLAISVKNTSIKRGEKNSNQQESVPPFIAKNTFIHIDNNEEMQCPPIVQNGNSYPLPFWNKLRSAIKVYLKKYYDINNENDYNKLLNDIFMVKVVAHDLKCHNLL